MDVARLHDITPQRNDH